MFLSLTKSMILWHNTKLKTIGAVMSTGCCRSCSAAVLSVLSVACLVFISPTFLSIYTFTDSPTAGWLCAPLFRLWAECSHENKQLPVCTLCSLCSAIHILDRFHKTRPGWKCYIVRHIPAIASQIELSCLTPLKISTWCLSFHQRI